MATSTAISNDRPRVRVPVTVEKPGIPVPALDWANGQAVAVATPSAQSSVFDAINDRIVEVSSNTDCWYSVGTNPTATKGAGSQFCAKGALRYVYVPFNNKMAFLQDAASGEAAAIPALIML